LLAGTRILVAIAAPLALALAILAEPILDAWVGADFDAAVPVVALLCAAVVVWMVSDTGVTMLMGTGRGRTPALIRVAEAVLNIGFSVWLAHALGIEGVAIATLIAAVAANLLVLCPYVCRQFGMPLPEFARGLLFAHVPPVIAALLVGWLVTRADPSGLLGAGIAAVAIVLAYLAVFSVTGLDRTERRAILARLRLRAQPTGPPA
jgi:O-antigen/teichoic acid export membrane protein